jgi:diguanylate cyclase (GGDEF)-like protein
VSLSILPTGFYKLDAVERGQAIWRVWGGGAFLVVVLVIYCVDAAPGALTSLHAATAYSLFGVIWLYIISIEILSKTVRRCLAVVLDIGIWSVGLYGDSAPIYALTIWVPLSVSMGNGLRYSASYGYGSALVSAVFASAAFTFSAYWRNLPLVALGVFLTIVIMPFYAFLLTQRVSEEREAIRKRTAELEMAASTDGLTGALNRAGIYRSIENALSNRDLLSPYAAVMMVDLDGFKAVNDTAGHGAGDQILREVADAMKCTIRHSDILGRLGGDEFLVAMFKVHSIDDALVIAQKIIDQVAAIRVTGHPALSLGASIGISMVSAHEKVGMGEIIHEADQSMYISKRSGKGTVTCSRSTRRSQTMKDRQGREAESVGNTETV